ncbi:hypothetical protein H2200_012078 [Cladophialophora chaetospira]|uniref:Uncharacterized protein n=1 Tax=Cladophialophora chaetospira TaxID=386627 RepID=A0AA38WY57_9EURO|nr:hypothetical protein H2200_012078 [Cladophialophora chaetospira]
MEHEAEEPQSGLSTPQMTDSLRSHHAELESNPDLVAPAKGADRESGIAPSKSSRPSNSPRDARQAKLLASIATLESKITTANSQLSVKTQEVRQLQSFQQQQVVTDDPDKAALAHAQVIANSNISLLKRYNEIKDVAMGMLSLIAEKEGKRLAEVMEERGISEKD